MRWLWMAAAFSARLRENAADNRRNVRFANCAIACFNYQLTEIGISRILPSPGTAGATSETTMAIGVPLCTATSRILAFQQGELQPMFASLPIGPISPSPTLRVERHYLAPCTRMSHILQQNVLTLFFEPARIVHTSENGSTTGFAIPTDAVVSSPRNVLESLCWITPANLLSVALDDTVVCQTARTIGLNPAFELLSSPDLRDRRLSALLRTLDAERHLGYPSGRLFLDTIEQALATIMLTSYAIGHIPSSRPQVGLAPRIHRRVINYIQAHLAQCITLQALADCAGLSPSHFARQFRVSTGTTPHQYVLLLRIERAKLLLSVPSRSILDISLSLGFSSPQQFATVFRRITGVTPTAYRKAL
jgi:AraC family transcriptional regulator